MTSYKDTQISPRRVAGRFLSMLDDFFEPHPEEGRTDMVRYFATLLKCVEQIYQRIDDLNERLSRLED